MAFEKILHEDERVIVGIEKLRVGGITIKRKDNNARVHVRPNDENLNICFNADTEMVIGSIGGSAVIVARPRS